jgi:hypothetical protein
MVSTKNCFLGSRKCEVMVNVMCAWEVLSPPDGSGRPCVRFWGRRLCRVWIFGRNAAEITVMLTLNFVMKIDRCLAGGTCFSPHPSLPLQYIFA